MKRVPRGFPIRRLGLPWTACLLAVLAPGIRADPVLQGEAARRARQERIRSIFGDRPAPTPPPRIRGGQDASPVRGLDRVFQGLSDSRSRLPSLPLQGGGTPGGPGLRRGGDEPGGLRGQEGDSREALRRLYSGRVSLPAGAPSLPLPQGMEGGPPGLEGQRFGFQGQPPGGTDPGAGGVGSLPGLAGLPGAGGGSLAEGLTGPVAGAPVIQPNQIGGNRTSPLLEPGTIQAPGLPGGSYTPPGLPPPPGLDGGAGGQPPAGQPPGGMPPGGQQPPGGLPPGGQQPPPGGQGGQLPPGGQQPPLGGQAPPPGGQPPVGP